MSLSISPSISRHQADSSKIPECKRSFILHANTECPLCLEEFRYISVDGKDIIKNIIVLDCFHAMCFTCFTKYITRFNTCAICRKIIRNVSDDNVDNIRQSSRRLHFSSHYDNDIQFERQRQQRNNRMLRDAPPLQAPRIQQVPRIMTIRRFDENLDVEEYVHGEEYINGTFQSANHQIYVVMFILFDLIVIVGWCFIIWMRD